MEPKFQTSFIPKKSDSSMPYTPSSIPINPVAVQNVDLFSVVSITLFTVALLAMGGMFGFKYYMKQQIAQSVQDLENAKNAFDVNKINDLIVADQKIRTVKELMEIHVASSRVLALLEGIVVKRSQFDTFEFVKKTNKPQISVKGEAQSFNALAKQQEIFESNESIKNLSFSDINITKNGGVGFTFTADIVPTVVSYKKYIESQAIGTEPVLETQSLETEEATSTITN